MITEKLEKKRIKNKDSRQRSIQNRLKLIRFNECNEISLKE